MKKAGKELAMVFRETLLAIPVKRFIMRWFIREHLWL